MQRRRRRLRGRSIRQMHCKFHVNTSICHENAVQSNWVCVAHWVLKVHKIFARYFCQRKNVNRTLRWTTMFGECIIGALPREVWIERFVFRMSFVDFNRNSRAKYLICWMRIHFFSQQICGFFFSFDSTKIDLKFPKLLKWVWLYFLKYSAKTIFCWSKFDRRFNWFVPLLDCKFMWFCTKFRANLLARKQFFVNFFAHVLLLWAKQRLEMPKKSSFVYVVFENNYF